MSKIPNVKKALIKGLFLSERSRCRSNHPASPACLESKRRVLVPQIYEYVSSLCAKGTFKRLFA
jgi:hypothetical protein